MTVNGPGNKTCVSSSPFWVSLRKLLSSLRVSPREKQHHELAPGNKSYLKIKALVSDEDAEVKVGGFLGWRLKRVERSSPCGPRTLGTRSWRDSNGVFEAQSITFQLWALLGLNPPEVKEEGALLPPNGVCSQWTRRHLKRDSLTSTPTNVTWIITFYCAYTSFSMFHF